MRGKVLSAIFSHLYLNSLLLGKERKQTVSVGVSQRTPACKTYALNIPAVKLVKLKAIL